MNGGLVGSPRRLFGSAKGAEHPREAVPLEGAGNSFVVRAIERAFDARSCIPERATVHGERRPGQVGLVVVQVGEFDIDGGSREIDL